MAENSDLMSQYGQYLPMFSAIVPGGPLLVPLWMMQANFAQNMVTGTIDSTMADQRYEDEQAGDFAQDGSRLGGGDFSASANARSRGANRASGFQGTKGQEENSNYRSQIMEPGYAGNIPDYYWANDENGIPRQVAVPADMQVNYVEEAYQRWKNLSPAQQIQMKQALYHAGFYPENFAPRIDAFGLLTPEDRLAMANSIYFHDQNPSITYDNMLLQMANAGAVSGTPYLYGGEMPSSPASDAAKQQVYTTTESALRTFLLDNGIDVSGKFIKENAQAIAEGRIDPESWQAQVRKDYIANAYPGLKDRVLAGENISTIASPYIQAYATTMGLDPSEVDIANPAIRKALQYTDESGKPGIKPLWKFEQELLQSDTYKQTNDYQSGAIDFVNTFRDMMGM